MAKFKYLVIALLLALSAFVFTESELTSAIQNTLPQNTVQSSTTYNNQGTIVDTLSELTVNVAEEDHSTFFKNFGVKNVFYKEQQEHYLVYLKIGKSHTVSLTSTDIIFPFHWFT